MLKVEVKKKRKFERRKGERRNGSSKLRHALISYVKCCSFASMENFVNGFSRWNFKPINICFFFILQSKIHKFIHVYIYNLNFSMEIRQEIKISAHVLES